MQEIPDALLEHVADVIETLAEKCRARWWVIAAALRLCAVMAIQERDKVLGRKNAA